ncbi:MAG: hypothetical protein JEZ12_18010 [Desulfobacterium sp.]|nr:hypothetical protein [Desulfobacterium sp.]
MAKIIQFEGKANREARKNVEAFICRCRDDLTVFGAWDNWRWKGVVNFTKAGAPSHGVKPEQLLCGRIMPFAKAYVRYRQGHKPTKLKNEIKAIRCIEPALLKVKGKADITQVDVTVLDEAVVVARKEYKATAYQAGNQLAHLADFLSEHHMANFPAGWKNPLSKPKEINRTGKKGKERRENKMPSDHELNLMAEMFGKDLQVSRDRYTTSTFALAMCAPGRISEFQDLTVDCLHGEKDSKGEVRLGLRFQAGKGYGADIKWVSTPFISIAKDAVKRLRDLTREARVLAKWLEDHPDRFYRHGACPNVGEDVPLTPVQIYDAMGWKPPKKHKGPPSLDKYFKNELFYHNHNNNGDPITLRILNDHIHNQLPKEWPWKNRARGIKFSNALFCMRKNELNDIKGVSPVFIWSPNKSTLTFDLGPRVGMKHHKSIWDRHGHVSPDGSSIKITSHQLRHFLNTIAQEGDLGQLYIAKWSGRVNISQNRVYNHMSEYEVLDKVKKIDGVGALLGPLEKVKKHMPVTLEDLNAIGECVAHVTEFGFCVHDFSMVPCQKHRDCLNCTEQVCIKGDTEKLKRLKVQRTCIKNEFDKSEQGLKDGYNGADRWYEHHKLSLARIDQLIGLLESNKIADGAVIRLRNDQEYSPLKREIEARAAHKKLPGKGPGKKEMRALLGGGLG